jgi:hypothetical protein
LGVIRSSPAQLPGNYSGASRNTQNPDPGVRCRHRAPAFSRYVRFI